MKFFRFNLVKALGPDQRKKIHSTFHNDFINDTNCLTLTGPTLFIFIKQNCCQDFYFNKICSSNQVFKTSMHSFIHALKTFKLNQGLAQTVEIVCIIQYSYCMIRTMYDSYSMITFVGTTGAWRICKGLICLGL